MNENTGINVEGHIKIWNPENGEIFVNKRNAIHYENMSLAIVRSLINSSAQGYFYSMSFGNGGTLVDPTGVITYLTPNGYGTNANLYNETYSKIVNDNFSSNLDPTRNFVEVRHVTGTNYSDIFITCLLDFSEPADQSAFDNSSDNVYTFDELGIKSYDGLLLTHVIFHPVQKSLNRQIQIDYTVRIQTLSGLTGA